MVDRGRQALWIQALEPIAETLADRNSYGFRPKRWWADAIDPWFNVLRQKTSPTWIWEGDSQGFCAHFSFLWLETGLDHRVGHFRPPGVIIGAFLGTKL
jgi:RNA-directed DNA polymerase